MVKNIKLIEYWIFLENKSCKDYFDCKLIFVERNIVFVFFFCYVNVIFEFFFRMLDNK